MAYHYDYELSDCWSAAKGKMDAAIKSGILSQYTYDKIDYINISTSHEAVTYKYSMLPVYVGNFTFRQKLYNFFVNGTTGKTWGKYPKSPFRVSVAVILGLAVAAVLVYLLIKGS